MEVVAAGEREKNPGGEIDGEDMALFPCDGGELLLAGKDLGHGYSSRES